MWVGNFPETTRGAWCLGARCVVSWETLPDGVDCELVVCLIGSWALVLSMPGLAHGQSEGSVKRAV